MAAPPYKFRGKFFKNLLTTPSESAIITCVENDNTILGHRQAVRHQTLTLTFPGFESLCPSQRKGHLRVSFLRWLRYRRRSSVQGDGESCFSVFWGRLAELAAGEVWVLNPCAPAKKSKPIGLDFFICADRHNII